MNSIPIPSKEEISKRVSSKTKEIIKRVIEKYKNALEKLAKGE